MLDWIGDVGGLQAALALIFGFFYIFFSINVFENFMVSQLFRAEKPEGSAWNDAFKYQATGQPIYHTRLWCIRTLFMKCRHHTKYERIFMAARKKLAKEMDIVRHIKKIRELRAAFKLRTDLTADQKTTLKLSKFKLLTLDLYKDS